MREQTIEVKSAFWVLQYNHSTMNVEYTEFDTASELDTYIEDVVVGLGEEGKPSNIIKTSLSIQELKQEVKEEKNTIGAYGGDSEEEEVRYQDDQEDIERNAEQDRGDSNE